MSGHAMLLAALGFVAVLAPACSDRDTQAPAEDVMPPAAAVARVSDALAREGLVYHAVVESEFSARGSETERRKDELWVDAARDVAHLTSNVAAPQGQVSSDGVMVGGTFFHPARSGPAPTCYGATPSVSLVVRCDEREVVFTVAVQAGTFDDRETIAIVIQGERDPGDGTLAYTRKLHLDPQTWLPIAEETEGTWGPLAPVKFRSVAQITSDFVSAASLAASFFDPPAASQPGNAPPTIEVVVMPGGGFQQTKFSVPAEAMVAYRLVNRDPGVAHNLAVYFTGGRAASRGIRTGSCEGPCTRQTTSVGFGGGPGQELELRCDLHPDRERATLAIGAAATVTPSPSPSPKPAVRQPPPSPPEGWVSFRHGPFAGYVPPGSATFFIAAGDPSAEAAVRSADVSLADRAWLLEIVAEIQKPRSQPFAFFVLLDPRSPGLSPRISVTPCFPGGSGGPTSAAELVESWRRGGSEATVVAGFSAETQVGPVGLVRVATSDSILYHTVLADSACTRFVHASPGPEGDLQLQDLALFLGLLQFAETGP